MSKAKFKITGEFQKEDGSKFSEQDKENLTDDLLTFLEKNRI